MKNELILLSESYEQNPLIKGLIQLLPGASAIDTALSTKLNTLRSERLKTFFDLLNAGKIQLSPNIIETNEFLHAFFATTDYVLRTRSNEKIERFAKILLDFSKGDLKIEDFEYYIPILNDLSDLEFSILTLKLKYENDHLPEKGDTVFKVNGQELNPLQTCTHYWKYFIAETIETTKIAPEELQAILLRIQRTGCYQLFKGFWDDSSDQVGNTTPIFHKLVSIIDPKKI